MTGASAQRWALALILLVLFLLYQTTARLHFVGCQNDDAVYVALSRALDHGLGYRDIYLADSPLHNRYPPGFPILLAALQLVFPTSALQVCMAVVTWLLVCAAIAYASTYVRGRWLLLFALAFGLNWLVMSRSGLVMSDAPYLLLLLLAQLCITRGCHPLCIGLLLAAAISTRSTGVIWVMVLAIVSLLRGNRSLLWASLLALLAGVALQGLMVGGWNGYARDFHDKAQATSLGGNLAFYWVLVPDVLSSYTVTIWPNLARVVIWIILLVGYGVRLAREEEAAWAAALASLLFFLWWPYQEPRFTLVALPWLVLSVVLALRDLSGRAHLTAALVGAWLLALLFGVGLQLQVAGEQPPLRTIAWLRQHTPPSKTIAAYEVFYWLYTDHKLSILPVRRANFPDILEALWGDHCAYLVDMAHPTEGGDGPQSVRDAIWLHAEAFSLVFEDRAEGTRIFRVSLDSRWGRAYNRFIVGTARALAGRDDWREPLQQALLCDPDMHEAAFNLATMWQQSGNLKAAEQVLVDLLRRCPRYLRAHLLYVEVLRAQGKNGEARAAAAVALGEARKSPLAEAPAAIATLEPQSRQ